MPITKDYSIAVDSTMSPSSPESSPQVVRRAGRTYGRRISEPASSSHSDDAGVESPASVYLTAPQRLDEEVPPSSDGFNAFSGSERADSDSEDPERPGESAPFQFEWQRRVNQLSSDDEDAFPDIQFGNENQAAQGASPTISGTSQVPPGELGRTEQSKEVALSSDLVESLPASPNSPLSRNTTFNKSSRRRRILPGDSDTELDSPLKSPYHSAIPSLFENNTTTTSNSQLILTSPTSDDEVASALFKKPTHPSKRSKTRSATSSPHQGDDEDHSDSSMGPRRTKQRGDSQRPNKKGKVKAPTKKELADTERARARLLAEQPASIARTNDPKKLTFKLLSRLQNRPVEVIAEPSAPSSDPITQFDSSPVVTTTLATANNKSLLNLRPLGIIPPVLDDEDDLPDVRELSRASTSGKSHSVLNEQKKLWLAKGKAVGRTNQDADDADDSDDDLVVVESVKPSSDMHVVAQEAAAERRTQKQRHLGPSKGKRMVERLAHPRKETDVRKLTQADLLKQLKGDIYRQNIDICEQKEAAWEGVGGTVGGSIQPAAEPQALAADAASKLARSLQASVEGKSTYEESNDEASDDEYVPPPDDEAEAELVLPGEEDVTMVDDGVPFFSSQETENDDAAAPVLRRSRAHVVLNSDSENDDESENRPPKHALTSQSPVPSIVEQLSSLDERTEDEDDKENSTGRMYDKGDDKENKAVVRHGIDSRLPFGPRKVPGLGRNDTRLSLSPGTPGIEDSASQSREPFKDLLSDEDPFKSPSQISFTARLLQTSPKSSVLPSQQFTPQKLGGLAFSQDEDQENCENVFEPKALQPSFSQMFQSQTQVPSSSAFGGLHKLRDSNLEKDLPLTLDLPLQPALDVDENIRKQADDVFEREQEYILEALQPKAPPTQPKVYINDHGFLTQTRPDVDSPEVYKMFSPSQPNPSSRPLNGPNFLSQTPVPTQGPRHPLRTISYSALDELDETPSVGLNRLRRHRSPSLKEDGYGSSPTQSPVKAKQQNAFDILSRNAMRQGKDPRKGSGRDGVAKEFLQDEAEESDDEMGNWGPRRSKDEEEEEGDADTTLVELMDDNVVDENANKVIEKFQEHQQEDDEKLQKYHQNAVDGKFRHKKRNHLGFDSSDDEGSDEEDAARRRKMYKRARIERDHIKRLGQSDETKAFAMVYQDDLVDDQILVRDSDDIMAEAQPDNDNEEGSDSDDVNDAPNVISAQDVRRELREKAESGDFQVYDVNDVSWLDDEDEPSTLDDIQIKQASNRPRLVQTSSSSSKRRLLDIDIDLDSRPSSQHSEAQSNDIRGEQWARSERRSGRLETTGRSVSRVAVTGHKGGSGGVRMKGVKQSSSVSSMAKSRSSNSSGPVAPGKRDVKASRSMVLGAVDRRGRFE